VPNVVDTDEFSPGPGAADLDALAGMPAAPPGTARVGLVATYARWKGHLVFLEAAARLARERPGLAARFYVVGGPVYQTGAQFSAAELREQAAALGLAGSVGFVGFQERPAAVYRALDVVVHASTRPEPFGLVIAEAMACGRAVVAARAGGAAELFAPGEEALGVPPGDPAALAAAVAALAGDPDLGRRLGVAARAAAVRRFAQGRLGPQLRDAYQGFLTARRAPQCSPPPQFVS
jgi:glycosyltransferase involved in cell wall biosynthesis